MNEDLARLPVRARLLFAGLWCLADREGRLEDRPSRIKAALFPYEPRVKIEALIRALELKQFVKRYTVAHTPYLALPRFAHHQHPHPKEPESKLPAEPCNFPVETGTGPAEAVPRYGKEKEPTASRPVPFRTYAAIAAQVVKANHTDDLGELGEQFKRACARQGLPYDATITTKALSTATRRRA